MLPTAPLTALSVEFNDFCIVSLFLVARMDLMGNLVEFSRSVNGLDEEISNAIGCVERGSVGEMGF